MRCLKLKDLAVIVRRGPESQSALSRVRGSLGKAGKATLQAVRDIGMDVLSETIKKMAQG